MILRIESFSSLTGWEQVIINYCYNSILYWWVGNIVVSLIPLYRQLRVLWRDIIRVCICTMKQMNNGFTYTNGI